METYFRNLLATLHQLGGENRYLLMCDRRYSDEFLLAGDAFSVRAFSYAKPSVKWLVRGIARNLFHRDLLQLEVGRLELDVIHHPFTVLTPPGTRIPSVLTFWDMQQEFFPEFFSPIELHRRRLTYRSSAEEATRIIVSAEFTRQCLVERYGIPADKIDLIHTGYGREFLVIEDRQLLQGVRRKYGLAKPFLFYPAATWPHKNHKTLLAALKILRERHRFDGDLVLSGIAMQAHGELRAEISRLGLDDAVKVVGYLPAGELPCLYNLATALVFPSLFEGFGIPLVEAMACGCPVACSRVTSLPEVVGDVGVTFDPRSPEEMAEQLWRLWDDDTLRDEMRQRGLARARLFNWEETARKTLAVYRKAAGGAP